MLYDKGMDWNKLNHHIKYGTCIIKSLDDIHPNRITWNIDYDIPKFTQNRDYIDNLLKVNEE